MNNTYRFSQAFSATAIVACLVIFSSGCHLAQWNADENPIASPDEDSQPSPQDSDGKSRGEPEKSSRDADSAAKPNLPKVPKPDDGDEGAELSQAESEIRIVLVSPDWVLRVNRPASSPITKPKSSGHSDLKWRHAAIEDLLARPANQAVDFSPWLSNKHSTISGNAAIAIALRDSARLTPAQTNQLADALSRVTRNPKLNFPMRQAAAESFSLLSAEIALPSLRELAQQYGAAGSNPIPELEAILISSMLRLGCQETDSLVLAALQSTSAKVRLAIIQAWPRTPDAPLGTEVIALRHDRDPQVRAATIEMLAARRTADTPTLLTDALRDHHMAVRSAAILGLGEVGGPEAMRSLDRLSKSSNTAERAAAVAALGRLGSSSHILRAANDEKWQVRVPVARALRTLDLKNRADIAQELLQDDSANVALAVVASASDWPLPEAGPVLLEGMASQSHQVRKAATQALGNLWPPAKSFNVANPVEKRNLGLLEIRQAWQTEYDRLASQANPSDSQTTAPESPAEAALITTALRNKANQLLAQLDTPSGSPESHDLVVNELIAIGPKLLTLIDEKETRGETLPPALYESVLPKLDDSFDAANRLSSETLRNRRRAAQELVKHAEEANWNNVLLRQIAARAILEQDPLIWRLFQKVLSEDAREPAVRMHYAALSHPEPDVRRHACLLLDKVGDRKHQDALLLALEDKNSEVIQAAARALASCGKSKNPLPLVRLLASRDARTRLAAAQTLAKLGHTEGVAAMERLAHHDDFLIRRETAIAFGEIDSAESIATLLRLLGDHPKVQQAAIAGLEKMTNKSFGTDPNGKPVDIETQVAQWRELMGRQTQFSAVKQASGMSEIRLREASPESADKADQESESPPKSDSRIRIRQ